MTTRFGEKLQLLDEYESYKESLAALNVALTEQVSDALARAEINIHSFSGRIKKETSLRNKISRPDRNYSSLGEVTDLLGFRIITYSEDQIEEVAKLIEENFDVDLQDSINKLRSDDHQRFGYRSLHYVCHLPRPLEAKAPASLGKFRFEIQIRTILQHAWAEIEHDIGYKATEAIPGPLRRRFSQVAGLLEIADREFVAIRSEVQNYEEKLARINFDKSAAIPLDYVSLKSLVNRSEVSELDRILASALDLPLAKEPFFPDYLLLALLAADLNSVQAVLDRTKEQPEKFLRFVDCYFRFAREHWNFGKESIEAVQKGYSLLFLAVLHSLEKEKLLIDKVNQLTDFFSQTDYPKHPERARAASEALVNRFKMDLSNTL